ncbi:hypothetical protein HS088_TW20G00342 [Tripterygium wilfordii]|uniref:MBD domain-containing protein n=1 Tax=Tripterygium wilfordii TaxID=458696 RepID=A0A7J7C764_TRIWF|nr:uncharacterized protein LOC119987009 [Tripterygium wilfordii]KAF5729973.1 hypothetical protein HS088_TW20G00342 [Tripterygium wilfordii]
MVARRPQQDGLPPGWTVQLKQMRSGRTIRYFMNSQTGQKFSSKEDLIRYVKMKSTLTSQNEDPPTTKKHIDRHSENMDIQVVKKTNEEWLPEGWEVESKTRNSGARSGTKYKCYIDPSTGSKFYSKPEVFRYLEGVKHQSCLSTQKKSGSVVHSTSKVVIEKSEVTDLPRGWIKELKIKTVANRVRKDPYYTDPVSGYVFRSKKDVLRYLESGKISKSAFLSQKRHINDPELIDNKTSASCATKRQKLQHPASILQPFTGKQSSNRSGLAVPENEASKKILRRRGSVGTMFSVGSTDETLSEKASVEKRNDRYDCPSTNYDAVLTPAHDLKGKSFLDSGMEKSSRSSNNSSKSNKKKWRNLPCRSSKRLAGLHSLLPKVELSERNQQDSTPTDDRAVSNSASDLLGMNSLECEMEKSSSRSRNNSGKTNRKEGLVLPCRFSKRTSGLKTVLPKVEFSESNHQKITLSGDKVFNSSADLIGKNSLESKMQKGSNRSSRNNSGKSNKKGGLDLPRRSSRRLAGLKAAIPKVELSETNQQEIPLSDNKTVINSASELITENSLEKGMEKSSSKKSSNNSGKSNKKSTIDVPRRSSTRLAGFKADMSKNSSCEQVPQSAVIESENEVVPAVGFTSNSLADEGSGPYEARPITELARHAFIVESIPSVGELLNKSEKSLDDQVMPTEQFQTLEAEKSDLRFRDPCLEFAFKTLTGAMPLEDSVADMPISTCAADILREKNLHDGKMGKSCNKKFWTDVGGTNDKIELNMPSWSFKETALLQNELVGSSALKISAGKSCQTEPNLDFDLAVDNLPNGASQRFNSWPEMAFSRHDSLHSNAPLHEGPSKSKQSLKDQIVAEEEPQPIESDKVNGDKPVSQVVFPSGDYWSDPCLEFAFKTLTGAIPLDNFAISDFPQQHLDTSHKERDGSLAPITDFPQPQLDTSPKERDGNLAPPDFGLPCDFQSVISSHFDASQRQPGTRQQLPLNPSVPPTTRE